MLLDIQVCLRQDVDATVSSPVPIDDLTAHVGDITKVE